MKSEDLHNLFALVHALVAGAYGSERRAVSLAIRLDDGSKWTMPLPGARQAAPQADKAHSPDFRSVNWAGQRFTLTLKQAMIIQQLWKAWESGCPDVSSEYLLEAAESQTGRIDDLFRGNSAWQRLIVSGARKGTYRLADTSAFAPKLETAG